jgi:hypothetical protein
MLQFCHLPYDVIFRFDTLAADGTRCIGPTSHHRSDGMLVVTRSGQVLARADCGLHLDTPILGPIWPARADMLLLYVPAGFLTSNRFTLLSREEYCNATGSRLRLRVHEDAPDQRWAEALDEDDQVIGYANESTPVSQRSPNPWEPRQR